MNDITALAQRIPERKRHDWSQSVMRDCDFCNQWALTVKHEDGARICASCCDAEYTSKLEVANAALVEALEARDKLLVDSESRVRQQNRHVCELFDENAALRQRIAELESRTVTAAAADVLAERQRQVTAEGWTPEHDDEHSDGEMALAASSYALYAHKKPIAPAIPYNWPWEPEWFKQQGARRDLVKAGALILAEIERLDRAAGIKVIEGEQKNG